MLKKLSWVTSVLSCIIGGLFVLALSGCVQPLTPTFSDTLQTGPLDDDVPLIVATLQTHYTTVDEVEWAWHIQGETNREDNTHMFRWRLNGGAWTNTTATSHEVHNLPNGRHTFELQVRNSRGQWFALGTQTIDIAAVRYLGNGQTQGMPPFDGRAYSPGDVVTIAEPPADFSRNAKDFLGWFEKSDPSEQATADDPRILQPGDTATFPSAGRLTLTAVWDGVPLPGGDNESDGDSEGEADDEIADDPEPVINGSGTPNHPYVIGNVQELILLAQSPDMWATDTYFELGSSIDLSGLPDWEPIGSTTTPFRGHFDGRGYHIRGMSIASSNTESHLGFFGKTDGATISDSHVDGTINAPSSNLIGLLVGEAINTTFNGVSASGSVTGNQTIGGVAGRVTGSELEYAHADVYVTSDAPDGEYSDIGGLIGDAQSGTTLLRTSATGTVTASGRNAGGLVGWFQTSPVTIEQSWASGSVEITGAQGGAGGLVGAGSGTITIIDSYATGDVTIPSQIGTGTQGRGAGGLVGQFGFNSSITRSWSGGTVTGQPDRLGGLVGDHGDQTVAVNSYWVSDFNSGIHNQGRGMPISLQALREQDTFHGWDFDNVWDLCEYPFPTLIDNPHWDGNGDGSYNYFCDEDDDWWFDDWWYDDDE